MQPRPPQLIILFTIIAVLAAACAPQGQTPTETASSHPSRTPMSSFILLGQQTATPKPEETTSTPNEATQATSTPALTPTEELTPEPPPEGTSAPIESPTQTLPPLDLEAAFLEPAGCREPVDDYSPVTVNGFKLNRRTYAMLQYAQELYGGEIDLAGAALTQGSYSNNGPASFGTHLGGGVVDISVIRPGTYTVLYNEIEPAIRALRTAGFAAWLRDWSELAPGSGIHIHAVAVGDRELSEAAIEQLTGEAGYFRGYAGYLDSEGKPGADRHGGPVVCEWMAAAGYADLRDESQRTFRENSPNWQVKLREAAKTYLANSHEESVAVARRIDYLTSNSEDPSLMCGPLAAALLRDAGVLPPGVGPAQDLHAYWLADPDVGNKPWAYFPSTDYSLYRFDTPLNQFDFSEFPLRPGDFLYTYAKGNGFEHMFVVTEVDDAGRAYTVANQFRGHDQGYLIERLLLYDPSMPGAGVIYQEWQDRMLGLTGHDGFDLLRIKGLSQPPGSWYEYRVRPGDTVTSLAWKYYSTPEAIAAANPGVDVYRLEVGSWIWVPVNLTGFDQEVPFETPPEEASHPALERHIKELLASAPSGDWSIYLEDLATGEVIAIHADEIVHPASTIKVAIALVMFTYLEENPQVSIERSLTPGGRSIEQLLAAMLEDSEETATEEVMRFLTTSTGIRPQELISGWGAASTTLEPRRSTAADLGLLWKRLYKGEILSPESTSSLLAFLRARSNGDDERIGAGLPVEARASMAHKTGTTFESGLGVVADSALVETGQGAYILVVIGSEVDWVDFETAKRLIADISEIVYQALLPSP